jgi:hypothetical protein
LSFVLFILAPSFRLVASRLIPGPSRAKQTLCILACILAGIALSGCGGSGPEPFRLVSGVGFHFEAPATWTVRRSGSVVTVRDGVEFVQVARFPLVKAYRPALFAAVARELRVRMGQVARGSRVEDAGDVTVDGIRSHVYRLPQDGYVDEYTFVLAGRREFQLLCRETKVGAAHCSRLQVSFHVA